MENDKSSSQTQFPLKSKILILGVCLLLAAVLMATAVLIIKNWLPEIRTPITTVIPPSTNLTISTPSPIAQIILTTPTASSVPQISPTLIRPTPTVIPPTPTAIPITIPVRPITPSNAVKLTFSNVISDSAILNPQPCLNPPDDYRRVNYAGDDLNVRTIWMLKLAQGLYKGRGDVFALTQGSYVNDVPLSFGTHAGGGVVDISVIAKNNPRTVLSYEEVLIMLKALRQAGFAAWLRLPEDLKPATGWHIHAVSVGDRELSPAARRQLDGPEGYFRGLDGVPPEFGGTKKDRYGGPVLCHWMENLGFKDLR